ncbi:MAG: hypothetical protein IT532_11230 [Burkholderiales bacterium]|nr:hypothetical protein [Burkholderiales bacterium]
MASALSIHRAPAAAVPLRFLLSAPWFAVAAGVLLLWAGPQALASRWTGAVLATTHLLTLGFMGNAMLGALLQLLPVAFGVPLPRTGVVAAISHPALAAGAACLAAAFVTGRPVLFTVAALLLGLAFAVYLTAIGAGIARQRLRDPLARVVAAALLGLLVTVSLGLLLATGMSGVALPLLELTDVHATWGLLGWTMLLVLGAALAVVPMFQMTVGYPGWLQGRFAAAMLAALLLWSLARWFGWQDLREPLQWLLAAAAATFALVTLRLQQRGRRRLQPDATFLFWRLGMLCLIAAVLTWSAGQALALQTSQAWVLLIGVLMLPGFAFCVIAGMLYKIVPFLLWLALQMRSGARPPTVKEIMPETAGIRQFWTHAAALVLLALAASVWNVLVYAGAAVFVVSSALLGVRLIRAALFARARLAQSPPLRADADSARWKRLS